MSELTVTVELPAQQCAHCGAIIVAEDWARVHDWGSATSASVRAQLVRAGVRFRSARYDLGPLCRECAATAAGHFTCALCGIVRTSAERHDSWGEPPDMVCESCYETVPAKRWEAFVAELEQKHRWDFA